MKENINMKFRTIRNMLIAATLLALSKNPLWAANPETDRSSANFDNKETGALQHTKDGANRALNNVDTAVHTAVRKVKQGAPKAKKKANDGLNKVDDTVHDR